MADEVYTLARLRLELLAHAVKVDQHVLVERVLPGAETPEPPGVSGAQGVDTAHVQGGLFHDAVGYYDQLRDLRVVSESEVPGVILALPVHQTLRPELGLDAQWRVRRRRVVVHPRVAVEADLVVRLVFVGVAGGLDQDDEVGAGLERPGARRDFHRAWCRSGAGLHDLGRRRGDDRHRLLGRLSLRGNPGAGGQRGHGGDAGQRRPDSRDTLHAYS